MSLIAFHGKSGSGKSTAANYLLEKNPSTKILSFATPLKEIQDFIIQKFNLPNEKYRDLLQFLGGWVRDVTKSKWKDDIEKHPILEIMKPKIKTCIQNNLNIVIDDVRMKYEIEFLKNFGFKIIKITGRENTQENLNRGSKNHITEKDLDDVDFEFVIENDKDKQHFYSEIDKFSIDWNNLDKVCKRKFNEEEDEESCKRNFDETNLIKHSLTD